MTKDEKIKEVMELVLKWGIEVSLTGEANFMATRTDAPVDDVEFLNGSMARMQSAREAIEAKLHQLIRDDAPLEVKTKEFPRLGPKIEAPVEYGYYPEFPRANPNSAS